MFQIILFSLLISHCSQHSEGILSEIENKKRDSSPGSESSCYSDDSGKQKCSQFPGQTNNKKLKLFRWDPVEVGYVRELELEPGKKYKMITKSVYPPVFIVPEYLDDSECQHIMNKAKSMGLMSSQLHLDPETIKSKNYTKNARKEAIGKSALFDLDEDGVISIPDEIKRAAVQLYFLYLNDQDVEDLIHKFNIPVVQKDGERYIDKNQTDNINFDEITEYLYDIRENHPRHRDRTSDQVWLNLHEKEDSVISNLMERLEKLTGLDHDIVYGSEPLQVLRYGTYGHYHAHFDSQNQSAFPTFPCCHTRLGGTPSSCRLCRYATVLYYLNDVVSGGETAFPVADDKEFEHAEFLKRIKGDLYNLSQFCKNASLVVPPKKGTAVFWYNHKNNEEDLLGILDPNSLHGGCDVIEGEKWIANNWIPAPDALAINEQNIYSPSMSDTTKVVSEVTN